MATNKDQRCDSFLFRTDPSGIFTSISPEVFDILGYRPEELAGRSFRDLTGGEVADHVYYFIRSKLQRKELFTGVVVEARRKDGRAIQVEINGYPVIARGVLQGYRGIVRDVTEQLCGMPGSQEPQAELYLDLVCHDINNMNQIVVGYLELAMQSVDPASEAVEYMGKSIDTLFSCSSLISSVQKLQQLSAGSMTVAPVDLCGLIREVIGQHESMPGRDVVIRFAPASGCQVLANELLRDVFHNIIGNAIKHAVRPPVIEIGVAAVAEGEKVYWRVTVEDNGPGIPDDMKGRAFNRFQHGDTATSGRGLGLYLARKLVEGFRGRIRVEDRVPGDHRQGSRFVVLLPAAG